MPSNPPPFHFGSCRGRIRKVSKDKKLINQGQDIKISFAAGKNEIRTKLFDKNRSKLESGLTREVF